VGVIGDWWLASVCGPGGASGDSLGEDDHDIDKGPGGGAIGLTGVFSVEYVNGAIGWMATKASAWLGRVLLEPR
jgi:hypothetical protein